MNGTTFDTLSAAEALEAAGISKAHAKAIAVAIRNGHRDLATKAGIGALKAVIVRLESRIGVLDSRLNTIEWAVGIQTTIMLATFAIVAAKLL